MSNAEEIKGFAFALADAWVNYGKCSDSDMDYFLNKIKTAKTNLSQAVSNASRGEVNCILNNRTHRIEISAGTQEPKHIQLAEEMNSEAFALEVHQAFTSLYHHVTASQGDTAITGERLLEGSLNPPPKRHI